MVESLRALADVEYGASPKEIRVEYQTPIKIYGTGGLVGYSNLAMFEMPLVVVARKGTLDKPIYSEGPCWVIDTAFAVIPKNDVDAKWLYFQLSNFDLKKLNEATGVPSINRDYLYRICFEKPPHPEQRKIARILSTIDSVIDKTQSAIDKYKAIKQGMLHDLFTRGIDIKTGKLRPQYEEAPELYKPSKLGWIPKEWEVESLEKLCSEKPTYGINAPAVEFTHQLPTYIRITDIDEEGKFSKVSLKCVDSPFSNQYVLKKGDIVFARTGATVGKTYLYDEADGVLVFAGFLIKVSPNENLIDSNFLKFLTETPYYLYWVIMMSQRSGQPGINGNEYGNLSVPQPKLNEQKLISAKLLSVQNKINFESIYLNKLQMLKSGLMSDLLSGKKPVKVNDEDLLKTS